MKTFSPAEISLSRALVWMCGAWACFHLAYEVDWLRGLIVGFLFCLVPLTGLRTSRKAFYVGLLLGFGLYAPQLGFFWTIFEAAAIVLWLVLAFWIGLFLLLGRQARRCFGAFGLASLPALWLGLEYFRSESYYLRFSWLTPGGVFAGSRLAELLGALGSYGIGALLLAMAAALWRVSPRLRLAGLCVVMTLASLGGARRPEGSRMGDSAVEIAGAQLEFPGEDEVLAALERLARTQPGASLYVLSEYTFKGPVPERITTWCRDHRKYLIAGGEDLAGPEYFNTAFVTGPDGRTAFKQAKSVPIQFFRDGLPARDQRLWSSPWGRIGLGVCYDLSYRRVMDRLIAQGCQALIIPTMDVTDWGERQHRLHARVAPMRAAEYGVPIFRLCSSGISQVVESGGRVIATAPYPGQGAMLKGTLVLGPPGRRPLDHWLGPAALGLTAAMALGFSVRAIRAGLTRPRRD